MFWPVLQMVYCAAWITLWCSGLCCRWFTVQHKLVCDVVVYAAGGLLCKMNYSVMLWAMQLMVYCAEWITVWCCDADILLQVCGATRRQCQRHSRCSASHPTQPPLCALHHLRGHHVSGGMCVMLLVSESFCITCKDIMWVAGCMSCC